MAVDERGQRSQVLLSHLLELLRFRQHTLDQQGVHVLSRDSVGTEKMDAFDTIGSCQSEQAILDQDSRYTSWHLPVAAATSCQDMVT